MENTQNAMQRLSWENPNRKRPDEIHRSWRFRLPAWGEGKDTTTAANLPRRTCYVVKAGRRRLGQNARE
jgi:hypothetical protein